MQDSPHFELTPVTKDNHQGRQRAALARIQENLPRGDDDLVLSNVVQLPLWPHAVRAAPNAFLRSALFAAVRPNGRRFIDGETLAALSGLTVWYKGPQLTQIHLTLWLQLTHLLREKASGERVEFTAYSMLKALHWRLGPANYKQLDRYLTDLQACSVRIEFDGKYFSNSLVGDCARDKATLRYVVEVQSEMVRLLAPNTYTYLDWEQRLSLGNKYLALSLLDLYASHVDPFPYSVAKLWELTGSQAGTLRFFRRTLREALAELKLRGVLVAHVGADDLVRVQKSPKRANGVRF